MSVYFGEIKTPGKFKSTISELSHHAGRQHVILSKQQSHSMELSLGTASSSVEDNQARLMLE